MKTYIVSLLFVLSIQLVNSQNYFSDSTSWTDNWINSYSQELEVTGQSQYFIVGDTLIADKLYKKLFMYTTYHGIEPVGAIREIDKKVFYIGNNAIKEALLYDFSVVLGDTIKLHTSPGDDFANPIVTGIDSITTDNGERRKRIRVSYSTYWIEGIGDQYGFLSPVSAIVTNGTYSRLVCFKQKGIVVFSNPKFCYGDCCSFGPKDSYDNLNKVEHPIFQIVSNNSEKRLEIELNEISQESIFIKLIDSSGRLVTNRCVRYLGKINFDISSLKNGFYIVVICSKQKVLTHKIVIR